MTNEQREQEFEDAESAERQRVIDEGAETMRTRAGEAAALDRGREIWARVGAQIGEKRFTEIFEEVQAAGGDYDDLLVRCSKAAGDLPTAQETEDNRRLADPNTPVSELRELLAKQGIKV